MGLTRASLLEVGTARLPQITMCLGSHQNHLTPRLIRSVMRVIMTTPARVLEPSGSCMAFSG